MIGPLCYLSYSILLQPGKASTGAYG